MITVKEHALLSVQHKAEKMQVHVEVKAANPNALSFDQRSAAELKVLALLDEVPAASFAWVNYLPGVAVKTW